MGCERAVKRYFGFPPGGGGPPSAILGLAVAGTPALSLPNGATPRLFFEGMILEPRQAGTLEDLFCERSVSLA